MSASIIVESDNLAGQIKLERQDGKVIVGESNISKILTNRNNDCPLIFNNSQEIINKIKEVMVCLGFTSRYMGKDMYDNKLYNYNNTEFNEKYVYGIQDKYDIPAGVVMFHTSNDLLFECTNIEFMINANIISFKYTNIKNKIYLVKRSNGSIQDTCIIPNGGIYFKNDILRLNNNFSSDPEEKLNPGVLNDLQKGIHVKEFCEVNDIKLEVKLPYFNQNVIDSQEAHIAEVLIYYNDKLSQFSKLLVEKFPDLLIIL
jgi:hypothetical protein